MAEDDEHRESNQWRKQLKDVSNVKDVEEFLHAVADTICGRVRGWKRFGESATVTPLVTAYSAFLTDAVGNERTVKATVEVLTAAGVSEDASKIVATVVEARRSELVERLRLKASTIGDAHLKDFDWSLRLVMSSDRLESMREPVVLVNLRLTGTDGDKDVPVEMNKVCVYVCPLDRINVSVFPTMNCH